MTLKIHSSIIATVLILLTHNVFAKPASSSEMTIAAGELSVEYAELYLNGESIFIEEETYLYDLGEVGVLVEGYTGG